MELKGVDLLFWALGLLGHCVLLGVLLFRGRARRFPIFTTLIAASIVKTGVLYLTHRFGRGASYFYTYWSLAFVDVGLELAVVYELSSCIFRPMGAWAADVRRSFAVLLAGSVAVASVLTWLASPPTRTVRLALVTKGDFFSEVLLSELFLVMLALSVTMGFSWRTHVARLTQGFGVYSIFCVLTEGAHTFFGSDTNRDTYATVSYVRMTLYCACLAYWIVELAKNEPEPRKLPDALRLELRDLQRRVAIMLQSFRAMGRA